MEVTGTEDKIDAIFNLLKSYGVVELVRTGSVSLVRGPNPSTPSRHVPEEEGPERYEEGEPPYSSK